MQNHLEMCADRVPAPGLGGQEVVGWRPLGAPGPWEPDGAPFPSVSACSWGWGSA